MRQATDVAGVCKDIVLKTAMSIQGRKYVRVEGWQSIATAHGCIASSRDVERVDGGFRAVGEIRKIDTGAVICTAEGFVGEDEATWFGGEINGKKLSKRPDYAIRAMTQTRAISRACRSAFAHVVVLMDAGLATTPAEEVPEGGFTEAPPTTSQPKAEPKRVEQVTEDKADRSIPAAAWRSVIVPKFVKKYAGMTLGEMEPKDIAWWSNNYEPKPFRGVIQDADLAFRKALTAASDELANQSTPKGPADVQSANQTKNLGEDVPL